VTLKIAPINAKKDDRYENPKTIAKAVNRVAPLATPKVYGVLIGFLKTIWNTTPPIAKTPPLTKANNILGTLISQNI
jgi:hypothetical protein